MTQKKPVEAAKKNETKESWEKSSSNLSGGSSSSKFVKKSSAAATFASTTAKDCLLCKKSGHQTEQCFAWKSLSPGEMLKTMRELRLCQARIKPFGYGHKCEVKCKTTNGCGKRHLTHLHEVVLEHERQYSKGGPWASGTFGQKRSNCPSSGGAVCGNHSGAFVSGADSMGLTTLGQYAYGANQDTLCLRESAWNRFT
jgi:hypothetical protein